MFINRPPLIVILIINLVLAFRIALPAVQTEKTTQSEIAIGKPAPDFEGRTVDGRMLKLSGLRGKVVLLDFMASWCGVCVGTLPEIKKLYGRLDRSKFEIISVSLDGGENTDTTIKDLKRLLAEQQVDWPVLFDDTGWENQIARSYRVGELPVHVVIDREGIIRSVAAGKDQHGMEEVRSILQKLM
jgi:peroxiredoxin